MRARVGIKGSWDGDEDEGEDEDEAEAEGGMRGLAVDEGREEEEEGSSGGEKEEGGGEEGREIGPWRAGLFGSSIKNRINKGTTMTRTWA